VTLPVQQLRDLGYDVGLSSEAYEDATTHVVHDAIYRVRGFGVDLTLSESDPADSLLDLVAHEERVAQHEADPPVPEPAGPPQQERVAEALEALPDGPVSKADLAAVIAALRG